MQWMMDGPQRREILERYLDHVRRFDEVAARRNRGNGDTAGELASLKTPVRRAEQALTAREREVLQLIADGLVNREIGVELHLSEETVKSHVRHLLAKLQARSRAHAVAIGLRRELVE
jgi:DNA-binding NarL/FixJ family response regulator